jgi:uncharacterized repeat protein (TIGR02543 family)
VVLTATPDANATFVGWGGACAGTEPGCTVVMSEDRAVSAVFVPNRTLTVVVNGPDG